MHNLLHRSPPPGPFRPGTEHSQAPAALGRRTGQVHPCWMDPLPQMPAVFLSHGSPMLAIQDSAAGRFLDSLGQQLPRPKAVVVASAHFLADRPMLGGNGRPHTVHDFGGFPAPLYQIGYPAPGDSELAAEIAAMLAEVGLEAKVRAGHGLDHGVWVPMRRMYPAADVPVVPLSVNPSGSAAEHHAVGRALAPLRDQGVLVIGSGGFVHNLGDLDWRHPSGPLAPWAAEFSAWMHERLSRHDWPALFDWENRAPHARHAHPTTEHLMPLFVALGAAGDDPQAEVLHRSHELGTLALDAFVFR